MENNLEWYNGWREVPANAQRKIQGGNLSGKTDINPMWRIKALTEKFGPVGIGWYTEIVEHWEDQAITGYDANQQPLSEICSWVRIKLYVKDPATGEWSKPIEGVGGNKVFGKGKGSSINDECVDGDCEVLTRNGWVKFKDYNGEDELMQYDKNTRQLSFVKPVNFIKKESIDTYKFGNMITTGGHRNLIVNENGKIFVKMTEELATKHCAYKIYKSGYYGENKILTPIQKVGIMIACNGKNICHTKDFDTWKLQFSKTQRVKKCRQLLKEAGITEVNEQVFTNDNHEDCVSFSFKLYDHVDYKIYEEFIPYGNYIDLWSKLIQWNRDKSGIYTTTYTQFCSTNKRNIDYIQTLLALSGIETSVVCSNDCYVICRKSTYTYTYIPPVIKIGERTTVYCVEVPTTFFLLRKGNEIIVTGNCVKMAETDAISVACKKLGIGADIYWDADATKYTSPVKANDKPKPTVDEAVAEMEKATDRASMVAAYHKYKPFLDGNAEFDMAVRRIGAKFPKSA